ncbi:MAG: hypothetical protein ACT4OY_04385 [Alphaproteobacteria bacterium]
MRALILIAFFMLHFTPAFAEDGRAPAIRTIYNTKSQSAPDKPEGLRTMNYVRNKPEAAEKDPDAKSDSDIAWEKYKALAAGTPEEEKIEEETEKSETPASAPPETGFASILSDYKKNKAQRAQLRTLSVSKVEDLPAKDKKHE